MALEATCEENEMLMQSGTCYKRPHTTSCKTPQQWRTVVTYRIVFAFLSPSSQRVFVLARDLAVRLSLAIERKCVETLCIYRLLIAVRRPDYHNIQPTLLPGTPHHTIPIGIFWLSSAMQYQARCICTRAAVAAVTPRCGLIMDNKTRRCCCSLYRFHQDPTTM